MMNKLAINTVGDEIRAAAEFCRSQGIGLEVTDFAFPNNLNGDVSARIDCHVKAVEGIEPLISHGPFLDLVATSQDSANVSRNRHKVALEATHRIGAATYVAHTNYNAMIKNPSYKKNFTRRMLDFWLPFADWAAEHEIVICLENLWEPGPEIQAEIVTEANHPNLKVSFDNGHALVFSEIPARKWIKTFAEGLAHCHLHDNSGELDEHNVVGDGNENWDELLHAASSSAPSAILVVECDRLAKNKESIERLRSF